MNCPPGFLIPNGTFGQPPETPSCGYNLDPQVSTFGAEGGSGEFDIDTVAACAWTAIPSADWITITSAATGAGDDTITYDVDANASGELRIGSIYVGNATHLVYQLADVAGVLGGQTLLLKGGYAYIGRETAAAGAHLITMRLSDGSITEDQQTHTGQGVTSIAASATHIFAVTAGKLSVWDVSDTPNIPVRVDDGSITAIGGATLALSADQNTLFAASDDHRFHAWDVSDPANPVFIAYVAGPADRQASGHGHNIQISSNGLAWVGNLQPSSNGAGSVSLFNVTNPSAMTYGGEYSNLSGGYWVRGMAKTQESNRIIVSAGDELGGIFLGIFNATTGQLLGSITDESTPACPITGPICIDLANLYVYLTDDVPFTGNPGTLHKYLLTDPGTFTLIDSLPMLNRAYDINGSAAVAGSGQIWCASQIPYTPEYVFPIDA